MNWKVPVLVLFAAMFSMPSCEAAPKRKRKQKLYRLAESPFSFELPPGWKSIR